MCLALRTFYSQPEHVLIPQVRNGTGFTSTRTADAIAMVVWPSRGFALTGIEIKARVQVTAAPGIRQMSPFSIPSVTTRNIHLTDLIDLEVKIP
jgi:hypothetical protein